MMRLRKRPSRVSGFNWRSFGSRAFLAVLARTIGGVAILEGALFFAVWADDDAQPSHPGWRSRPLEIRPSERVGFSSLDPHATGLTFTNSLSQEKASENQIRLNGSGTALGDVDGDGWVDIYLCGLENGNRLYRNLGNWRFDDATDMSGLACPGQYSTGATFADLDGDSDLDLFVNSIGNGTRCFLNSGQGRFQEVNAGLARRFGASSLALADIDGDRDLDLYVANYRTTTIRSTGFEALNVDGRRVVRPQDRAHLEFTPEGLILEHGEADLLYRNEGDGRFGYISWLGGSFLDASGDPLKELPRDWGLSVMFRDLNQDRAPDVYVCNDFHSPDRAWINDGRGRFQAIDPVAIRHTSAFSMGGDFGDLNRDGADDLLVADMLDQTHERRIRQVAPLGRPPDRGVLDRPQVDQNTLQLNRGDGTFAEIARFSGLEASGWTWSVVFADVDLDGFEDVLMTTGHMFDTQDLDANDRIQAMGPFTRETIAGKVLLYPSLELPNAAFRNRGDLTFEETSAAWGFDHVGISHGMALADLDNDGDLDAVVNHLNAAAGLYRNESAAPRVAVRLKGRGANTQGIGAVIRLMDGAVPMQSQEVICGGRYLSGDDPMRVFAAGASGAPMKIEVLWRSGTASVVENVAANRVYEIEEAESESEDRPPIKTQATEPPPIDPYFEDASALLSHRHVETPFDDFQRQPLMSRKLSELGPGVCWFDVDADGWDDLIVGGKSGRLSVFLNQGGKRFQSLENEAPVQSSLLDSSGIVAWTSPEGRALALAGVSNYEDGAGPIVLEHELGSGRLPKPFPDQPWSAGPLALGDADGDGDLDLFVGGRAIGGRYPQAASSELYLRVDGRWKKDETNERILRSIGLVSGAVWSDLDADGHLELVLACEWGPIRVFASEGGRLEERTDALGLSSHLGWWNGVTAGDFDGDGRLDLVASNWGLNSRYRGDRSHPWRLYYGDFNGDGVVDLVDGGFDRRLNQWAPERHLAAMARGWPDVGRRFSTHAAYAAASLEEVIGDALARAERVEANTFQSTIFLNRGDRFELRPLPPEAQFAPAFGVGAADFDGDGREDVFLSQNFFATEPRIPRQDAGRGLWLRGDGAGGFESVDGRLSGVKIYGQQRGCAMADFDRDGRVDLVATQNGEATKLFRNRGAKPGLRVRLRGTEGNPTGVGATIRIRSNGRWGPAREIHAGSGYWSQDSATQVMAIGEPPHRVQARWPGGKTTFVDLPEGSAEVQLAIDGAAVFE